MVSRTSTSAPDPRWKSRAAGGVALVLFVLVLARGVFQATRAPALNWDMLPAMALALEWSEKDELEVHRRTYAAVRAELPPAAVAELTAPGVKQGRAQDPAAFHEHLPFYRARVLYTLAIAALHGLGAPLTAATWWIPIASYVATAALVLCWCARRLGLALGALFALALAETPALLTQARFSTADGLATLLVVAAGYLFVERRRFWPAAALLTLSLGARPDGVILIGFLAAAAWLGLEREERPRPGALAGWLGASALVYLGLTRFAGEYGWWPLVSISFDEKTLHPAALPTAVDWGHYFEILGRQLAALPGDGYVSTGREVSGSTLVFVYAGVAVLGLARAWRAGAGAGRAAALLAALLAAYSARWFLFPQVWDRFYAPFYALVPLCVLSTFAWCAACERGATVAPENPLGSS